MTHCDKCILMTVWMIEMLKEFFMEEMINLKFSQCVLAFWYMLGFHLWTAVVATEHLKRWQLTLRAMDWPTGRSSKLHSLAYKRVLYISAPSYDVMTVGSEIFVCFFYARMVNKPIVLVLQYTFLWQLKTVAIVWSAWWIWPWELDL